MEETVNKDVMEGELKMVKEELGRMKRKYDDMVGKLRDKVVSSLSRDTKECSYTRVS